MSNNWFPIWKRKKWKGASPPTFADLLDLDGYDEFGGVEQSGWLAYIDRIATILQVQPSDTIFEVGCGAGAFLYPWHTRGHRMGGLDYSKNLVGISRHILPGAEIGEGEAANLDPAPQFDFVMAQSVFFYFPGFDYASDVLEKMILKARKGIAILDVPDLAHKEQSLAFRRKSLGETEYEMKYASLDHLYYDWEWFHQVLRDSNLNIQIEAQNIPGYVHNPYRFNVFITLNR